MNLKEKKRRLALSRKRDALIGQIMDAQLKLATQVKVIKEFSSVVTFLDEEIDPLVFGEVVEQPVIVKPPKMKPTIAQTPKVQPKPMPEEKVEEPELVTNGDGSDYWERRY